MTAPANDLPQWPIVLLDHLQILSAALKEIVTRLPADRDALLTAEQLGEIFQLSPRTLKDQAGAGAIPHHRFGKHYRFSRGDIQEILRITQHQPSYRSQQPRIIA
jgi:excisionase family DNA binding protein